jgi:hypothetical protein
VLLAWVRLAISLAGGESGVVKLLADVRGTHQFPLQYLAPSREFAYSHAFLLNVERAVIQYVVIKPACAVAVLVASFDAAYEEGVWAWGSTWAWCTVLNNVSVTVALYGVLYLYFGLHNFHSLGLTPKLMCIKVLVGAMFYQGLAITVAEHFDLLPHIASLTVPVVVTGLQDALVCLEMVGAAWADAYAYPVVVDGGAGGERAGADLGLRRVWGLQWVGRALLSVACGRVAWDREATAKAKKT